MGNASYYSVQKLLSSSLLSKNLKVRIILPVVLYGCVTWTLTLREEQRLRVFENKVLRKIFVAKRDEVTGEWRKLHNTELHALYSSRDIIRNIKSRRLRWAEHVARMDESRNAYRVLYGRPKGNRPLGRPRRRWEDNIKMDLREVGYDDREWINLAQSTEIYPAFAHIGLRENPGKNLNQVTCPDRDLNPGHLVWRLDTLDVTPQTPPTWLSRLRRLPVGLKLRAVSIPAWAIAWLGFIRGFSNRKVNARRRHKEKNTSQRRRRNGRQADEEMGMTRDTTQREPMDSHPYEMGPKDWQTQPWKTEDKVGRRP
ncbi:hypothetical protein ANN_17456 [Periplaneta americana]|uniref:Reverse transcriptase n=1 Tax=Periplaneta americana TaxID=6978 RepID=A0ABQ8STK1_PERAM|nr:hypothetical protein ANN_17456 [Periplaneta americana]